MATTAIQTQNTELAPLRQAVENQEFMSLLQRAVGERAGSYAIGIINAANANPELLKCELSGLLTAGLTAAAMNLSLSPALGQACILPFKKSFPVKKSPDGKTVVEWGEKFTASFVVEVRGLKNLALRTQQYTYLNDFAVYSSQTVIPNQMTGVPTVSGPENPALPITHYGAYLKLTSGYEHAVIWTVEDILAWGKEYSPTYNKQTQKFSAGSRWITKFDAQARKTVTRFLINHYGVISERDKAFLDAVDEKEATKGGILADIDALDGEAQEVPFPAQLTGGAVDATGWPIGEDGIPVFSQSEPATPAPASKAMPRSGPAPTSPRRAELMAKFSAAWNLAAKDKLTTPENSKVWGVSGSSTEEEIEAKTALIYGAIQYANSSAEPDPRTSDGENLP